MTDVINGTCDVCGGGRDTVQTLFQLGTPGVRSLSGGPVLQDADLDVVHSWLTGTAENTR